METDDKHGCLKSSIKAVYERHKGSHGYRRITAELRQSDQAVNRKTVQRLMNGLCLKSLVRPKKYRSYRGGSNSSPNVLDRPFDAARPNEKWVTDVTEFSVRGARLYLSPVMDLYNGEIVTLEIQERPLYSLVQNMLKKAGVTDAVITGDPEQVRLADRIILPGVGHFDYGMRKLRESPAYDELHRKALEEKVPVLGICLGAQLLTNRSEEGREPGLGWIDAETVRFEVDRLAERLPIPHMGWSEVDYAPHPLFEGMHAEPRFYFVHSYYLKPRRDEDKLCMASYGHPFAAGIQHENIMGVQFHPEKSHKFGLRLLENFVRL
ncbi:MAG: imidazole glycerol phosphate synthase subunit HisH [Chitinophagaceae bacterium]|nr:MAG: imidazole glycerol phosphate synthase subunit HisH [Chitinophagaceae bacterium]